MGCAVDARFSTGRDAADAKRHVHARQRTRVLSRVRVTVAKAAPVHCGPATARLTAGPPAGRHDRIGC